MTTKRGTSPTVRSNQAFSKEEAMSTSFWLRMGAIWGFLAVAIGAFGAHGLKDQFKALGDQFGPLATERPEGIFQTATHYHAYCALAILAVGLLAASGRERNRAPGRRLVVSDRFADLLRQPVRAGRDGHQEARHDHADRRSAHAHRLGRAGAGGGIEVELIKYESP